jgi:hypothetical protein
MKTLARLILSLPLAAIAILAAPMVSHASPLSDYVAAAPFKMPVVPVPVFPDRSFVMTEFGAVGDEHTLNTEAFAKAISPTKQRCLSRKRPPTSEVEAKVSVSTEND